MKIGVVTHYYDRIGVAVLQLEDSLKVGDKIRFERGGEELFEQEVESIQMDHKDLPEAKKGDEIGLKTTEAVKEGTEVFRV